MEELQSGKNQLPIWDQRMLLVMKHLIDLELCDSQKDFLERIGFQPTNLRQVRSGSQSFTIEQILDCARKYKISVNWIMGLSTEMRLEKSPDALTNLRDAVRNLEAENLKN